MTIADSLPSDNLVAENQARASQAPPMSLPTIWGLDLIQLHDCYWAARGVQVVRLGAPSSVVDGAEMYLLTDADTLVLFRARPLLDTLSWVTPLVLFARVHEQRRQPYQEHAVTTPDGSLRHFERSYECQITRTARVAFTADRDIAQAWQTMGDARLPWRRIRRQIPAAKRETLSVRGHFYDLQNAAELERFAADLMEAWHKPSAVISRAVAHDTTVWADCDARISPKSRIVGHVWVGAGRVVAPEDLVVGPAMLWDDPAHRPLVQTIQWRDLEPTAALARTPHVAPRSSLSRMAKRAFDIAFALMALILTLPLYPLIILAILLEDGRPFFFTHERETLGGRQFPCLKFRSMRKDAEKIKAELKQHNEADGPQFFMENDPRLTRVGRILRKANLDELPQFFNVLAGDMSIVGPRPSPRHENQFCPAWREARLSVRPGITGLWQVNRTRLRGSDFQEWIKYDIEYVEHQSWRLDIQIILKTLRIVLRGITSL